MSHDIELLNGIHSMIDWQTIIPMTLKCSRSAGIRSWIPPDIWFLLLNDILDMNKLESGDIVDRSLLF